MSTSKITAFQLSRQQSLCNPIGRAPDSDPPAQWRTAVIKGPVLVAKMLIAGTTAYACLGVGPIRADAYPARAVHFVVPFPGGPSDLIMRLYAQGLSQDWKQAAVVEDRPGATGTIGTEAVVQASPDGYTLLFTIELPITMAPSLLTLRYDPQRDLVPIAAVAEVENVLVTGSSSGIHSLAELVAAAKAAPGKLTFASAGLGSPAHLCGEMIKRQAGIDITHVPYAAAAPAMNAILAGDVTMFCGPIAQALPFIKDGKANALGVTGATPSSLLPEVAPLSASYPGLVISNWFGLLAPARTPGPLREALEAEFKTISASPELQQKLRSTGVTPTWISGVDLAKRIAVDTAKWHEFMATANIHVD
jgi:tripartite-type tricarboxylate transporter receptor subunit TctC